MKESHFDVEMLNVPVKTGSNMHERMERFEMGCGSHCLIIVNEITLSKASSNISNFIPGDVVRIIPLLLADQFPF